MQIRFKQGQMEEVSGLTPEYPYFCHHTDYNQWQVPWHWHEEVEFNYIIGGKMRVQTTEREYIFNEGEAFFINGNVLSTMGHVKGEPVSLMDSNIFHPIFLSGHFRSIFETKYIEPVIHNKGLDILEIRGENDNQKEMLRKLKQIRKIQDMKDNEFEIRNILSELWILLLKEIRNTDCPVKRENQDRIQTMLSYIHQHYHKKVSSTLQLPCPSILRGGCFLPLSDS